MTHTRQMTTREAAARLEVSTRTVARLVERHQLTPSARLELAPHGVLLFDPAEVDRVCALRAKKAGVAK